MIKIMDNKFTYVPGVIPVMNVVKCESNWGLILPGVLTLRAVYEEP